MSLVETQDSVSEFSLQNDIFNSAITIGLDYMKATGELPEVGHLENLYFNGHFDYHPQEMEGIFHDWDDFLGFIQQDYSDYLEEEKSKKELILGMIGQDRQTGIVPDVLFKAHYEGKDEEQIAREAAGGRAKNNLRILTDQDADDDDKIKRYLLYKIVEQLTANLDEKNDLEPSDNQNDPLLRRVNIVLRFNIANGKLLSSLTSEISKSNSLLSASSAKAALEIIADERGWLDQIDPEIRQKHLRVIGAAANKNVWPLPEESFYDLARGMLLGKTAVDALLDSQDIPDHVRPVADVLLDEELEVNFAHHNPYEYASWKRRDYLAYGKWLMRLLEPRGEEVDRSILIRSFRLGLGPGESVGSNKNFKSLEGFYQAIGRKKKPRGRFAKWSNEDWVDWIKSVAADNDGKVSEKILGSRAEQGIDEPTIRIIKKSPFKTLAALKVEAGIKPYNQRVSREECLLAGQRFVEENGRLPKKSDFGTSPLLPSESPIYDLFEGIPDYNKHITILLEAGTPGLAA